MIVTINLRQIGVTSSDWLVRVSARTIKVAGLGMSLAPWTRMPEELLISYALLNESFCPVGQDVAKTTVYTLIPSD